MGQLLRGVSLAREIQEDVLCMVAVMKKRYNRSPLLCVVQVGDHCEATLYLDFQKKVAQRLGISCRVAKLDARTSQEQLLAVIDTLNADKEVNGIMVQLPLPAHLDANRVQARLSPQKDVEGIHPENLGKILLNEPGFAPCTACAVMELLKLSKIDLYGKEAVIVGHSEIVGKPLSLMLMNALSTVTVCHIATGKRGVLPEHVKRAEILVVAVGKPGLIKADWIQSGAVVIDVGITCVDGKVRGDVEFEKAQQRVAFITPVPGGVGPVTVAILMRNVAQAAQACYNGGIG